MTRIQSEKALDILDSLGISRLMEGNDLRWLIRENKNFECFFDGNVVVVIYYETECVKVIPVSDSFNIEAFYDLIRNKCQNPMLSIELSTLSQVFCEKLENLLAKEFQCDRYITDLCNTECDILPSEDDGVRLITENDRELFVSSGCEKLLNRPPMELLFDVFIVHGNGYILGAFEDGKVVGYLSFDKITDSIFDVDYIYVIPHMRNKGIGGKLARAYVSFVGKNGEAAYWSNAQNEASFKCAVRNNFKIVRRVNRYRRMDS